MIIQGKHAVLEAIRTESSVDRIVMSYPMATSKDGAEISMEARKRRFRVVTVPKQELDQMAPGGNTQGVIAILREWKYTELTQLTQNPDRYPIVVALDHLEDPYNMGAIFRTCAAFGVNAVIFPKDRQCQLSSGVIKTASGAIHHLDLVRVTNVGQAMMQLKDAGFWIYGTDVQTGVSLPEFEPNYPMALVLGNEENGVSNRVLRMADANIHIPMSGTMESLNVSVSAGILIYALTQSHHDFA